MADSASTSNQYEMWKRGHNFTSQRKFTERYARLDVHNHLLPQASTSRSLTHSQDDISTVAPSLLSKKRPMVTFCEPYTGKKFVRLNGVVSQSQAKRANILSSKLNTTAAELSRTVNPDDVVSSALRTKMAEAYKTIRMDTIQTAVLLPEQTARLGRKVIMIKRLPIATASPGCQNTSLTSNKVVDKDLRRHLQTENRNTTVVNSVQLESHQNNLGGEENSDSSVTAETVSAKNESHPDSSITHADECPEANANGTQKPTHHRSRRIRSHSLSQNQPYIEPDFLFFRHRNRQIMRFKSPDVHLAKYIPDFQTSYTERNTRKIRCRKQNLSETNENENQILMISAGTPVKPKKRRAIRKRSTKAASELQIAISSEAVNSHRETESAPSATSWVEFLVEAPNEQTPSNLVASDSRPEDITKGNTPTGFKEENISPTRNYI
ncbi:hypothetical protein QR680_019342 [Steinernema hermaphroditum]|uniref:Uncharacterized protein n=1 Tax=Steinernema hermaphroditum TaxID=289476 RepID=A0AA39GN34_9BILA|nr:hypothetical protein QR680_019342 [Steinernema hermaphroditum]